MELKFQYNNRTYFIELAEGHTTVGINDYVELDTGGFVQVDSIATHNMTITVREVSGAEPPCHRGISKIPRKRRKL